MESGAGRKDALGEPKRAEIEMDHTSSQLKRKISSRLHFQHFNSI
jgi:hypothetical protein